MSKSRVAVSNRLLDIGLAARHNPGMIPYNPSSIVQRKNFFFTE
ncbi:MAG TPA: hypothetical protein PLI53_02285 [Geobacteraceae bacterium]|nr:hypothetical protein [Geobacteraceae bacterium]